MNILFVHKSLVVGGAERILINYLNILSGFNKFKVTLLLLENKGEDNKNINQINKNINIDFILDNSESRKYTEFENKINQRSIFRKIYKYKLSKINKIEENRIKKYIKNNEFDLIVNFNSHLDFFLSNNQINIPIIRWIHGQAHLDCWEKDKEYYKKILPQHNYFFAINKEMQKKSQEILKNYGIHPNQVQMLYNPIDINDIQEKASSYIDFMDKDYLLNVSRLDENKNHIQMINIYSKLRKQGITEKLYIIGEGEYRRKIEQHIEKLNLSEHCILLGNQNNPYPFMKRAKLFLSTSLKEGLPTVLIESMACGTPVISMDCPTGPKEILNDGEFGGLIPLKNEQAFIQKTLSILKNKQEYDDYKNKLDIAISPFYFDKIKLSLIKILNTIKI
ncbi:TPA: glycosyltransferase [Pasteurella multocida]